MNQNNIKFNDESSELNEELFRDRVNSSGHSLEQKSFENQE
jgi:hypothetical protein